MRDRKYIVLCSGREHMEEMIALSGEWYRALMLRSMASPTLYL